MAVQDRKPPERRLQGLPRRQLGNKNRGFGGHC